MSCKTFQLNYFGGQSISSRNSSILLISVLTSPLKVRKGGCVPGARLCRSAGFLWRSTEKAVNNEEPGKCISVLLCWKLPASQPFEVHGGDVEHHPFKPEDHEEALREGTVADAFSIVARLHANKMTENKSEQ